jgi:hypothetical protein
MDPMSMRIFNQNEKQLARDAKVADTSTASEFTFTFEVDLHDFGRQRAIDSGTTEPLEGDVKALEEHARAMARKNWRPAYDPKQSPFDAAQEERFVETKKERGETALALKHAESNLRDAERDLALADKAGVKPEIPKSVLGAVTAGITISAASVIHDRIFGGLDNMLAWMLAGVCSSLIGAMLVFGILQGRGSRWRYLALTAGVIVGVALFALRWSGAEDFDEQIIAVGLSLLEVGAVLVLEHLTQALLINERVWEERFRIEHAKIGTRDVAQLDADRAKKAFEKAEQSIQNHIQMLQNRSHAFSSADQLEDIAVKTVLDGYGQGVAENCGRVRGTLSAIRRQAPQEGGVKRL